MYTSSEEQQELAVDPLVLVISKSRRCQVPPPFCSSPETSYSPVTIDGKSTVAWLNKIPARLRNRKQIKLVARNYTTANGSTFAIIGSWVGPLIKTE